ncbi:hypothetical protein BY458DRAFT_560944 [Sporodiniella umbellata]|nr:hypothetical protein BY458DRAFT_560944 [Sporodiniella umbellata]
MYRNKPSASTKNAEGSLSDFFWQTPLLFNCQFSEHAKQVILSRCYEALWMNNESIMQHHFFPSRQELLQTIRAQSRPHDGREPSTVTDPTSWHANEMLPDEDFLSQRGRQCGHVFRKGEPVYRCRNCGLDDTCVFCSKCFHATQHDGHDILFSVSPGSGGCCDCGDPEAWKVPLQCGIHSSTGLHTSQQPSGADAMDPELLNAVRFTLVSVIDFLLDNFAIAPVEVSLNPSTEDLLKENHYQRQQLKKIGVPSDQPTLSLDPPLTQDIVMGDDLLEEDVDMDTKSKHPSTPLTKEPEGELYACIAWNDEAHAFSHVLESIMTATGWDWAKAKHIIDVIHVHGREIIAVSTDVEELRKIAAPLSAINFGVTIRPAKETFREQVAGLLVDWLNELISGKHRYFASLPGGDGIIRQILCEELCREWELRAPLASLAKGTVHYDDSLEDGSDLRQGVYVVSSLMGEDIEMFEPEDDMRPMDRLEHRKKRLPTTHAENPRGDVAIIEWDPVAMVNEYHHVRNDEIRFANTLMPKGRQSAMLDVSDAEAKQKALALSTEFATKLRLDYLMLYDLKLWKEVRIALRELYIASLASSPHYKKMLGKRLTRNYARLAESFLLRDREPENSIILFSVQLLTVPSVSDLLVYDYYFFGLICSTLTSFFLQDKLKLILPSERSKQPSRINCESRAFRTRRYFNAFHDLRYIMNVNMIKRVLAQDPLYLRQYLDLISLFQGMNGQLCQKDTHVEYESEIWVNAFNVTLQIAKCCRQFSDCFATLPTDTLAEKVETAITLITAISRVLKQIHEWGPYDPVEERAEQEKLEQERATTTTPTHTYKVYGATTQVFHHTQLEYLPPLHVVQYTVTEQPVSFHHPLHWLLSGLLEHAHLLTEDVLKEAGWSQGFSSIVTLFHDTKAPLDQVLLPILDFPVRTIVFSSQIRAGVWVRNGYGIRNQAHHYRDISLRENTYDADVFLLQLGFTVIEANQFLATLLDRFDLIAWFLGDTKHTNYDGQQTIFMVEELLNLLIVCVCERANMTGMSIQDKIQREIVHNLCLGITAYSDLTKRIPERITEHPEFDRILLKVAKFRKPEGVSDHGLYQLKEEYFDQVDTYFWHYSRNNREEADSILKGRWKRKYPEAKEEDFFVLPKTTKIQEGPFKHIGQLMHSALFVQMLTYAIWNIRIGDNHKSDTILDQTLYLILLAVMDENNNASPTAGFFDYVCSHRFKVTHKEQEVETTQEVSLFDVMALLYDDENFSEIKSRLDWTFGAFANKGSAYTQQVLQEWNLKQEKAKLEHTQKKEQVGSALSELEKKKLAAKERQLKIMAQIAKDQALFMEQNEDLYEEEETVAIDPENLGRDPDAVLDKNTRGFCAYPTGTCIVCQEDVNERSLAYGILGLIQTSNILRETPMDDDTFANDIYQMGPSLDTDWKDQQCLPDNASGIPGFPAQSHKTGLYSSTCGHLMHIKCFEVYCSSIDSRHSAQLTRNHPENRTRREFMCPLCKSLGNVLLPVFWKGKKESFPGVLAKENDVDFSDLYKTKVNPITHKLKKTISVAWRVAQNKKTTSSTSRMKDVMAQLLPTLPVHSGEQPTNLARPVAIERPNWPPVGIVRVPRPPNATDDPAVGNTSNATLDDEADLEDDSLMRSLLSENSYLVPDGKLGPFENDTIHTTAVPSIPYIRKSYNRLLDVLGIIYQEICSDDHEREMSASTKNVDMLWGVMGYTISGLEIAARGSKVLPLSEDTAKTNTVFDQIPAQTQMLLRIMSDTIQAYTTIMCHANTENKSGSTMTQARVSMLALGRMRQIFEINVDDVLNITSHPGREKIVLYDNVPLLEDDPFMILTELSLHLTVVAQSEIFPFVRTMLLAEMAKTTVALLQNRLSRVIRQVPDKYHPASSEPSQDINAAKAFAYSLMNKLRFTPEEAHATFKKFGDDASFCTLLKFFVLPFLRRTLILMIVRFGLIVPNTPANSSESEFNRLLSILQLSSFDEFLQPSHTTDSLLHHWCTQHLNESEHRLRVQEGQVSLTAERLVSIPLDLPTPLYLIALPNRLDSLFDESMRRVCHKCGTVPSDPALCLFCGTFVCAQSFCCAEEEEGECNLHTAECGGEIGIFLSVKRCVMILLHNGNGWFMNAPYLDPHGEVDQGLRHGRPQYLNLKRYGEIRKLWLQHNIPIYVARQIEANYDIGGWTTL